MSYIFVQIVIAGICSPFTLSEQLVEPLDDITNCLASPYWRNSMKTDESVNIHEEITSIRESISNPFDGISRQRGEILVRSLLQFYCKIKHDENLGGRIFQAVEKNKIAGTTIEDDIFLTSNYNLANLDQYVKNTREKRAANETVYYENTKEMKIEESEQNTTDGLSDRKNTGFTTEQTLQGETGYKTSKSDDHSATTNIEETTVKMIFEILYENQTTKAEVTDYIYSNIYNDMYNLDTPLSTDTQESEKDINNQESQGVNVTSVDTKVVQDQSSEDVKSAEEMATPANVRIGTVEYFNSRKYDLCENGDGITQTIRLPNNLRPKYYHIEIFPHIYDSDEEFYYNCKYLPSKVYFCQPCF